MNDLQGKVEAKEQQGFFKSGMNSFMHPTDPDHPKDGYSNAENTMHRGGIVQTRPGLSYKHGRTGTRLQGFKCFHPKEGIPRALCAIDGVIYASRYPFTAWREVPGLSFSPDAEFVVMEVCLQSARLELDGTITLVAPREVVIIQDNVSVPGIWTGSQAMHTAKIPVGLWMRWVNNRLWIGKDSRLYASDLGNPLSFNENTYLAERSSFELPGIVTGVIGTSDEQGLLVFTDTTTTAFKSSILDRALWQQTENFQKVILPEVGCAAGRCIINQYGLTIWRSKRGLVSLNSALFTNRTSKLLTIDDPMYRSKRITVPDSDSPCAVHFENLALFSVPAGDSKNTHTWLMDSSPNGESSESTPSWSSVWTGIRPVEWSTVKAGGRERLYCASIGVLSVDGNNIHIWEAFNSTGKDNTGRIRCQMETIAFTSEDPMRMKYVELDLTEILGQVDLQVYVGGVFGKWQQVLDTTILAQEGSIGSPQQLTITNDSILCAYRPQSRTVYSDEFTTQDRDCQPENKKKPGIDKSFQVLLQWRGRMGVKGIRIVTDKEAKSDVGTGHPAETTAAAIKETGEEAA